MLILLSNFSSFFFQGFSAGFCYCWLVLLDLLKGIGSVIVVILVFA
jgi:hypothetical protein